MNRIIVIVQSISVLLDDFRLLLSRFRVNDVQSDALASGKVRCRRMRLPVTINNGVKMYAGEEYSD
jgi:hypothetical protein